jgi:hypothetical protein
MSSSLVVSAAAAAPATPTVKAPLSAIQLNALNQLQTGDVLLFHTVGVLVSMLFQQLQPSRFNHCGVVLRNPTWLDPQLTAGLYFLDSNDNMNVPDGVAQRTDARFGVHLRPLIPMIESMTVGSEIHLRKCSVSVPVEQLETIITPGLLDATYDFDPLHWLGAKAWIVQADYQLPVGWQWLAHAPNRSTRAFTCSALIAYVFTQLGCLPDNLPWSLVSPKLLSGETQELPWTLANVLAPRVYWMQR